MLYGTHCLSEGHTGFCLCESQDTLVPICRWVTVNIYIYLLKTGSLDNAIREFSLAKPSRPESSYHDCYKNGERMREFLGFFVFIVV